MKKQKRQVIKQLLQCVAIVTVGTLAIIPFMFVIWNDSRGAEPITDEQVYCLICVAKLALIITAPVWALPYTIWRKGRKQ